MCIKVCKTDTPGSQLFHVRGLVKIVQRIVDRTSGRISQKGTEVSIGPMSSTRKIIMFGRLPSFEELHEMDPVNKRIINTKGFILYTVFKIIIILKYSL